MTEKLKKDFRRSLILLIGILLLFMLCLYAVYAPEIRIRDNIFEAESIKINLNDGKPVINEEGLLFEPGMIIEKNFFVRNESSVSVYYKLCFEEIDGALSNALEITIKDQETLLYQGSVSGLNTLEICSENAVLKPGEQRDLSVSFYYPAEEEKQKDNLYLSFDLKAVAVQTKNNPNRKFS